MGASGAQRSVRNRHGAHMLRRARDPPAPEDAGQARDARRSRVFVPQQSVSRVLHAPQGVGDALSGAQTTHRGEKRQGRE